MRVRSTAVAFLLLTAFCALCVLPACKAKNAGVFSWRKIHETQIMSAPKDVRLELVSQKWQGMIWKHRLALLIPNKLTHPEIAWLFITGTGNGQMEALLASRLASGTGSIAAVLFDIPNQPIFKEETPDKKGMAEDQIIAYTFKKFIETKDKSWPALVPMREAAIRAMDAVQQYAKQELKLEVQKFVVTGGSKRGWTTWLTGAVDKRVAAIAPAVYDNLNLAAQMKRQKEAFGTYSEQIEDYTKLGLPDLIGSPEGKAIAEIVDPYTFRAQLTMPKLIIMGSNDPYWPLDASNLYWDDLVGEKYMLRVPNKGHDVGDMERLVGDETAFMLKAQGVLQFPKLQWTFDEKPGGITLSITSDQQPEQVQAWVATAPTMDFRKSKWESKPMPKQGDRYVYTLAKPPSGYAAIFGECIYKFGQGEKYFLSTQVRIIPTK